MRGYIQLILLSCLLINYSKSEENILERHKRQLLFPSPTLLQIVFAIAVPVKLDYTPFWVNRGFQFNFLTPWKLSQVPSSFLGTPPQIETARLMTKRDIGNHTYTEKILNGTMPEFTSEQLYHVIETLLESYGYKGKECLLHSVCELAKLPFVEDEDLFHELIHFILTPSLHDVPSIKNIQIKNKYDPKLTPFILYQKAEMNGKSGENCEEIYGDCPSSPLDMVSKIEYDGQNNKID